MSVTRIARAARRPGFYRAASAVVLAGLVALWALPPASVQASPQTSRTGKTKGLVVTYFWHAMYEGDDDCPQGPAVGMRRLQMPQLAKLPAAERERLLKPGGEQELAAVLSAFALGGKAYGGATDVTKYITGPQLAQKDISEKRQGYYLGPNTNEQCVAPAEFENPPLATVQGKVAYGLNLDGADGTGGGAPNSCAHQKFVGPAGEAGIDNQLYRVIGCMDGYRRKASQASQTSVSAGTMEDWFQGARKDGSNTILIEISGIDDERNSNNVQVAFYTSSQPTPYSTQAKGIPNYSLTAEEVSAGFANVAHGRIVNGVLTTDPVDLKLPYQMPIDKTKPNYFRGARLRMELKPDGTAQGLLAGYLDTEKVYQTEFTSFSPTVIKVAVFDGDCPSYYAALKKMADGYPDPKTGQCTAISSAFKVEAVPAFVIHPKETKTAENASGAKPVLTAQGR